MGRIDIVVFPNGGREIFGQISEAGYEFISACIDEFMGELESSNNPRKFTGYYDAPDASDIEWQAYDEENPIIMIPVEPEDQSPDDVQLRDQVTYKPMELAQVPLEMREIFVNGELHG